MPQGGARPGIGQNLTIWTQGDVDVHGSVLLKVAAAAAGGAAIALVMACTEQRLVSRRGARGKKRRADDPVELSSLACDQAACGYGTLPGPRRREGPEGRPASHVAALWSLLGAWYTQPAARRGAWALSAAVIAFTIMQEASWAFLFSSLQADVINEVTGLHEHRDMSRVHDALWAQLSWDLCFGMPLSSIAGPLLRSTVQVHFREFLTQLALRSYLHDSGHAYYWVKLGESQSGIDNPDQRIAEDAQQLVEICYDIFHKSLSAIFGFLMWTSVIFSLGGARVACIAIGATSLKTFVAWLGYKVSLTQTYQRVLQVGADFRYGLTRVRDSAEDIALGGGNVCEHDRSASLYAKVISAFWDMRLVQMRFGSVMAILGRFPVLVLWICMLPDLYNGALGVGDAVRVQNAYEEVMKVACFFVDNFEPLTILEANLNRFHELLLACAEATGAALHEEVDPANAVFSNGSGPAKKDQPLLKLRKAARGASGCILFSMASEEVALSLKNIWVMPPSTSTMVGGVSMVCPAGEGLLVMGPSGAGKTALLRVISGLWNSGAGVVMRPRDLSFVSSRSYMPVGTLADLVAYPEAALASAGEAIERALRRARLGYLLESWGTDASRDWKVVLSSGEQQRVAFARLLLRLGDAPPGSVLAVLDEATSAVDVEAERALYGEVTAEMQPGRALRGLVSVAHRSTLRAFHRSLLQIGGAGAGSDADLGTDRAALLGEGEWAMPDGGSVPWRHVRLVHE